MTEVTRSNFEEVLKDFETRLRDSHFISIDAEYTGIHSKDISGKNSLFDTPETRYKKLRESVVSEFLICQVGVALFERCLQEEKRYTVRAYNFYLFPLSFDAFAKRETFGVQVSCANFLAKNAFDFNKFFKEGVPFLNREKAESLRKYLEANPNFMNTAEHLDPILFPEKIERLEKEQGEELVGRLRGFSRVLDLLQRVNRSKPIVGHNMLMDLLLIYHHCIAPLPKSYRDFKHQLHEIFPRIYDTKFLAFEVSRLRQELDPDDRLLSDTNLFTLYTTTAAILANYQKPWIDPVGDSKLYDAALRKGLGENLEKLKDFPDLYHCHTASFDAVVTGALFLRLGYLAVRPRPIPEFSGGPHPTMASIFKHTAAWENQVNVGRCVVSNIHLAEDDPPTKRPDWIKVKRTIKRNGNGGKARILDVNAVLMRNLLAKNGDVEVEEIRPGEVIIACGGFGCFRKTRQELQARGYNFSVIQIPTHDSGWRTRALIQATASLTLIGILASIYLKLRSK